MMKPHVFRTPSITYLKSPNGAAVEVTGPGVVELVAIEEFLVPCGAVTELRRGPVIRRNRSFQIPNRVSVYVEFV